MEILNLFNNALEEVPVSISGMPKLRYVGRLKAHSPVKYFLYLAWLNACTEGMGAYNLVIFNLPWVTGLSRRTRSQGKHKI
jgi:hypothetical protein